MVINRKILILCLFLPVLFSSSLFAATQLFASGFEQGVTLDPPTTMEIRSGQPDFGQQSNQWWQTLRGSDVDGFSWPIHLWGNDGCFQYIIDKNSDPSQFVQTVAGPHGTATRALFQAFIKDDRNFVSWSRNEHSIYTKTEVPSYYQRFWLKISSELANSLEWLDMLEWKCGFDSPGGYRFSFFIYNGGSLYWHAHLQTTEQLQNHLSPTWSTDNKDIAVPVEQWFFIETYTKHSSGSDGRLWGAVNGQIVFDYRGQTKFPKYPTIQLVMGPKLYTDGHGSQWVDDIEYWDEFPCGAGISCYDMKTVIIVSAQAVSATQVSMVFNKDLDPATAQNKANYAMSKGVSIVSAQLDPTNKRKVLLTTAVMAENESYTVTVNNIKDLEGNPVGPNTQASFPYKVTSQ